MLKSPPRIIRRPMVIEDENGNNVAVPLQPPAEPPVLRRERRQLGTEEPLPRRQF